MPFKWLGNSGNDNASEERVDRAMNGEDVSLTKAQQNELNRRRIEQEEGRQAGRGR